MFSPRVILLALIQHMKLEMLNSTYMTGEMILPAGALIRYKLVNIFTSFYSTLTLTLIKRKNEQVTIFNYLYNFSPFLLLVYFVVLIICRVIKQNSMIKFWCFHPLQSTYLFLQFPGCYLKKKILKLGDSGKELHT